MYQKIKQRKKHPLYELYHGMRQRCLNPNNDSYKNYGERGITVHASWLGEYGFEAFVGHVGTRPSLGHSLDRIDNSKGYEPGNVRWATRKEQNRNSRWNKEVIGVHFWKTRNKWKVMDGETYLGIFGTYEEAVAFKLSHV